jgi:hypothetical protein
MIFENKRVLFFSPRFFGYENSIAKKIIELGGQVDYFDDRPQNDNLTKAIIRVNKYWLSKSINNYYQDIYNKIENKEYDYVFFLTPEAVPPAFILKLRQRFKDTEFILYMWDSIKNRKYTLDYLPYFDKKMSFDASDCRHYSLIHRPLFYADSFAIENFEIQQKWQLSFVGTTHSDRYTIAKKIMNQCKYLGIEPVFFFFYVQSKNVFYLKKIIDSDFRKANIKEMSFKKMDNQGVANIFHQSSCILDITHPDQHGLTMRTIETIGAKKKIITTNTEITKYDCYNGNISIIDRSNPSINLQFMERKIENVETSIWQRYNLTSWLTDVLINQNVRTFYF